ncbi:MAG: hypothetical protein IT342_18565 [Candidatus Melainabacteria bacterium]|nr:hypothetical protein [Candidatus Melainabacteria bacterium]
MGLVKQQAKEVPSGLQKQAGKQAAGPAAKKAASPTARKTDELKDTGWDQVAK